MSKANRRSFLTKGAAAAAAAAAATAAVASAQDASKPGIPGNSLVGIDCIAYI